MRRSANFSLTFFLLSVTLTLWQNPEGGFMQEKRDIPKDTLEDKVEKLKKAGERNTKHVAPVPLNPNNPPSPQNLKEMRENQDNLLKCWNAVFGKEQRRS
jgi:hypothetical protein